MSDKTKKRELWGDCFKAIAICLVVIGHSTGKFNAFIYQFHMAAFFWVSGYFTNGSYHDKIRFLFKKFCNLMLPTITVFLFGAIGMGLLNASGKYSLFFSDDLIYIGLGNMLYQFFLKGNNYVWWMGAAWFIITLYIIIFLHTFLLYLFNLRKCIGKILYGITICLSYVMGFMYVHHQGADLGIAAVTIGQLYFGIGVLCKNTYINERIGKKHSYLKLIVGTFISAYVMVILSHIQNITVDYPSGHFEHIILNVLAAANGIFFLLFFSKLIEKIFDKNKYIEAIIAYVGRNTLPIVYFHFLMFKVCIGALMLFGAVDKSYLQNTTPAQDNVGLRFLWLFLLVSVVGSISLWKLCNRTYVGRILLGNENDMYNKWYNDVSNTKLVKFVKGRIPKQITFKNYNKSEKITVVILTLLYVFDGILIIRQGIILNDELQAHLIRKSGFSTLLHYAISNELRMGRPLRILAAFNSGLSFITSNEYINRIIQVFIIGIALISFFCFIIQLFNQKSLAYISIGLVLTFLPLAYEHGAPNAFIGLTVIPLIELCIALSFWCKYLKTNIKMYFVVSMFFWILSLGGYEFIVTYTPAFILLYIYCTSCEKRNVKDIIVKNILPLLLGCSYIFFTFLLQKTNGVGYQGLTVNLSSFSAIWNVEKQLCLSAIPGYFLFNSKYIYLTCLYNGIIDSMQKTGVYSFDNYIRMLKAISATEGNDILKIIINVVAMPFVVLLIVSLLIVCHEIKTKKINLYNNEEPKTNTSYCKHILCFVCLVSYIMIPLLPNAVSKLYQETVSDNFFSWLPVSIFVFFTVCLCMGYIINICVKKWKKNTLICVVCLLVFIGIPVQYMNKVVSSVNHNDFERLLMIEDLFHTECLSIMDRGIVYAPDLYETRNLLAVNDGYWTEYAKYAGKNIEVLKEFNDMNGQNAEISIFFINDEYFCITGGQEIAILSKFKLPSNFIVKINNDNYEVRCGEDSAYWDNGFWCYPYILQNGKLMSEERAFINFIGTTLDRIDINGRWYDGWCTDEVTLKINSGEDGIITFEGYCNDDILDGKDRTIVTWCNGEKLYEYSIAEQNFQFEIQCSPNTNYELKLTSNFLIDSQNGDARKLSYILSNVY